MKPTIEIKAVKSSDIAGIGYNKETMMLGVAFKTGYIYLYPNCMPSDYAEFMKSQSKGEWAAKHLRHRKDHIKISPAQDPLVDALKGSIKLVKMVKASVQKKSKSKADSKLVGVHPMGAEAAEGYQRYISRGLRAQKRKGAPE